MDIFLQKALRFYFITDDQAPALTPAAQVTIALQAGATMVQYRNKSFTLEAFEEAAAIRSLCRKRFIPLIVNDNILLAKAVAADGVHLGQEDASPAIARRILGPEAIIGVSVHHPDELQTTDLSSCNYIGTGPVFGTATKADAQEVRGLANLAAVARMSPLPVVAIGGINPSNARSCFAHGAAGIAVISAITKSPNPAASAREMGRVCGCLTSF
ncbi:MAG: thiamine phosphate synthase [Desulfobacterales bacterium]|nr:MAG: thiamine phosphate synthase [Desulfobacterales bacterium]